RAQRHRGGARRPGDRRGAGRLRRPGRRRLRLGPGEPRGLRRVLRRLRRPERADRRAGRRLQHLLRAGAGRRRAGRAPPGDLPDLGRPRRAARPRPGPRRIRRRGRAPGRRMSAPGAPAPGSTPTERAPVTSHHTPRPDPAPGPPAAGPAEPAGTPPRRPGRVETETVRSAAERRRRIPRWAVKTLSPIALIALWQAASSTGALPAETLAAPSVVLTTAADLAGTGELQEAVLTSLGRVLAGLVLGIATAVVLATLSGLFRLGEDIIDAPVQMLRTVPTIGLIPLLIIWFGIGEEPKIALIALTVTFPLYMNIYGGIRNVDSALIE